MKNLTWLLLFNLCACALFAQDGSIATVKEIKGTAYSINMETGKKNLLKNGDKIKLSTSIETDSGSMLLLLLHNGSLKLILEKSRIQITGPSPRSQKIHQQIDRMAVVGGTKASDQSEKNVKWYVDEGEELVSSLKKSFTQRDYYSVVRLAEQKKLEKIDHPEICYYLGVSYLKLDLPGRSLPFFQSIVKQKVFEYYDLALFGAFLSHLKLGEPQKAQEVYLTSQKKSLFYSEMENLLFDKS